MSSPTDVHLAHCLATAKCVQCGSFQFSSKIVSPFKLELSGIYGVPLARSFMLKLLAETIETLFPGVDVLVGIRSGGAEIGFAVADQLGISFAALTKASEASESYREGASVLGKRVVILDDILTTGGSILGAAKVLRKEGASVIAALTVADHSIGISTQNFVQAARDGIEFRRASLTSVPLVVREAFDQKLITEGQLEEIQRWRDNPHEYGRHDLFTASASSG